MSNPEPGLPSGTTARWLRSLGSLRGTVLPLDLSEVPEEPGVLFLEWIREAVVAGVPEPHAATLATIGSDRIPDARTLLLKDLTVKGWAVAGPRSSRKAAQLEDAPVAALNFWWQPLVRAVRVRGTVTEATSEEIAADVAARPSGTARTVDDWMVWWIDPVRVEFWQGAASRNHTRLVYERDRGVWTHRVIGGEPLPHMPEDSRRDPDRPMPWGDAPDPETVGNGGDVSER